MKRGIISIRASKWWLLSWLVSGVLGLLIASDVVPAIRGPVDKILESRWPYYFVDVWTKQWVVGMVAAGMGWWWWRGKKGFRSRVSEVVGILGLVGMVFLWQISLVYASRFGMGVMFRRMAHPGMNGYFSAAVEVESWNSLVTDFVGQFDDLSQHARGHPPGAVLVLMGLNYAIEQGGEVTEWLAGKLPVPNEPETLGLWLGLSSAERMAAVVAGLGLHLAAAGSVLVVYGLVREVWGRKVAWRAAGLWGIIPSVSFFATLFDPVYSALVAGIAWWGWRGWKMGVGWRLVTTGVMMAGGLMFSLSLLPVYVLAAVLAAMWKREGEWWRQAAKKGAWVAGGIVSGSVVVYAAGYDLAGNTWLIIRNQAPREYWSWVGYNIWDVGVFVGAAVSVVFGLMWGRGMMNWKDKGWKGLTGEGKLGLIWVMVVIVLSVSGISRGETGRIWMPLMLVPVMLVAKESLKLRWGGWRWLGFMTAVAGQTWLMNMYWVPVW